MSAANPAQPFRFTFGLRWAIDGCLVTPTSREHAGSMLSDCKRLLYTVHNDRARFSGWQLAVPYPGNSLHSTYNLRRDRATMPEVQEKDV